MKEELHLVTKLVKNYLSKIRLRLPQELSLKQLISLSQLKFLDTWMLILRKPGIILTKTMKDGSDMRRLTSSKNTFKLLLTNLLWLQDPSVICHQVVLSMLLFRLVMMLPQLVELLQLKQVTQLL
tara:strand:+ start:214 stop:588 length:375 start_codon:yes stop_codon:yes gene_type:complete